MIKREETAVLSRHFSGSLAAITGLEKALFILPPATEDIFTRSQVRAFIRSLFQSDMGETKTGAKLVDLREKKTKRNSIWSLFLNRFNFMRHLVYAMPPRRHIHLFHLSDSSFLSFTLPVVLLARFLGKRITFYYLDERAESDLEALHESFGFALKLCDQIKVNSRYLQSLISGYNLNSDLVVLPSSVSLQSSLLSANLQPRIFMAGPLEKYANIISALKAFKLVKMKYPRTEMNILGDGSRRYFLEQYIANNNINGVEFIGAVSEDETYRLLGGADLYLNSSAIGSMPTSLVDAMTIGIPIISSMIGDIPTLLRDRESAMLVQANDHVSIADRIIELIEHPETVRQLTKAAHQVAFKFQ